MRRAARKIDEAPVARGAWDLTRLVADLRAVDTTLDADRLSRLGRCALPSREVLASIVERLRAVLFPAHFGASWLTPAGIDHFVGHTLDAALADLNDQIRRGLVFEAPREVPGLPSPELRAVEITPKFASRLPRVKSLVESDVRAAFEGDPASTSIEEAIFCSPGVEAILHHRLAHELYLLGVPLIPRVISEIAHASTGIDIHPGAEIGGSFFIDHGTGVVIGETCRIGQRVRLYQGVTLGARSFPLDEFGNPIKGLPRHPIVEDDVIIYSGATVLGRITVGRGSSVGGNVWLTRSVPPLSRITQAQAQHEDFDGGSGI